MLERIQGLPDNVLGIEATGEVTGADYEAVLIPAVEEAIVRQNNLRFLYHLGDKFSGFDAKAIWDDAKIGLQYVNAWERVAVVTDVAWIHTAVKVFGFAIPGQVRVFGNSNLQEAISWLST